MNNIDLNADLGEGHPQEALVMPFVSSANMPVGDTRATKTRCAKACVWPSSAAWR